MAETLRFFQLPRPKSRSSSSATKGLVSTSLHQEPSAQDAPSYGGEPFSSTASVSCSLCSVQESSVDYAVWDLGYRSLGVSAWSLLADKADCLKSAEIWKLEVVSFVQGLGWHSRFQCRASKLGEGLESSTNLGKRTCRFCSVLSARVEAKLGNGFLDTDEATHAITSRTLSFLQGPEPSENNARQRMVHGKFFKLELWKLRGFAICSKSLPYVAALLLCPRY